MPPSSPHHTVTPHTPASLYSMIVCTLGRHHAPYYTRSWKVTLACGGRLRQRTELDRIAVAWALPNTRFRPSAGLSNKSDAIPKYTDTGGERRVPCCLYCLRCRLRPLVTM